MSVIGLIRDWVIDPIGILFLLSLFLLYRLARRRFSLGLVVGAVVWVSVVLLVSAPRIVNPMILYFENQFSAEPACLKAAPIVLLGGGVDSRVENAEHFEFMSPATFVRATAARQLAKRFPESPILVAGGALRHVTEAEVLGQYLTALGVPVERIYQEGESTNTFENAKNVRALIDDREFSEDIILITSALHMKRAKTVFEKLGLSVCAVGVDRQGIEGVADYAFWPQVSSLLKFDKLLHEVIALFVYKVSGRL